MAGLIKVEENISWSAASWVFDHVVRQTLLYVSNDHESLISVFKEASLQSRLDYVDLSVMSVEDDSFTCGYLFSRSLWKVSRM